MPGVSEGATSATAFAGDGTMRLFILFFSVVSLLAVRSGWVEADEVALHVNTFVSQELGLLE